MAALDVAHIKPYSEFTKDDLKLAHENNGMLMRKDLHALYDKGYFTLENDGRIVKSKSFGLTQSYSSIAMADLQPFMSRDHLRWHREARVQARNMKRTCKILIFTLRRLFKGPSFK